MIKKIIQRQFLSQITKNCFSSGHDQPIPQKLQRVESKLIYMYVRNIDNVYEKIAAQEGQSLLEAILRNKVRSYQTNVCMGYDTTYQPHFRPHDPFSQGPQCGQCRVIFEDNWYKRVNQQTWGMSPQQDNLLKQQQIDPQSNTRLACCIPVQPWMNGMTLSVDPEPVDGGQPQLY